MFTQGAGRILARSNYAKTTADAPDNASNDGDIHAFFLMGSANNAVVFLIYGQTLTIN